MSQDIIIHTQLCRLLNIKYPIVQAGMGGHTTPELVAAVSNAGELGILGASRLTTQQLYVHVIGFVYQSIDIEIGSKGLTTNLTENITCAQRL